MFQLIDIPILRNLPNPFHTAIFHFGIRVKSFGHSILNDDLFSLVEQVNHLPLLRYCFVYF